LKSYRHRDACGVADVTTAMRSRGGSPARNRSRAIFQNGRTASSFSSTTLRRHILTRRIHCSVF
jgi:hypothetical protein